jgi:carbamoyltransferase
MPGTSQWLLGLGGSKHDYAACLLRDGVLVVAVEEERVTRLKRGYGVDISRPQSIGYCLDACGITMDQVDAVCVNDLLEPEMYAALSAPVVMVNHHRSHAASCFYPSPFAEAAILVADHSGARFVEDGRLVAETMSLYRGGAEGIELLRRIVGEDEAPPAAALPADLRGSGGIDVLKRPRNSIGRFYARIAKSCRCLSRMGDGELHTESGILMGLAAYGDNRHYAALREHVELLPDGGFRITMGMGADGVEAYCARVVEEAEARGEEVSFVERAALAHAAQVILEEVIVHAAAHLHAATGARDLCLAGGVLLNGLANYRILERTPFERVFVQPAAHDAGTAVGAAYEVWHQRNPGAARDPGGTATWSPYLGRDYGEEAMEAAIRESGVAAWRPDSVTATAARELAGGAVLGWHQGRSEFGPRALGSRSILAWASTPGVKARLDHAVKRREEYRPYAPMVRAEDRERYFDLQCDSPYMLLIGYVNGEWKEALAAVTHVDGTARVQTVSRQDNALCHELLSRVAEETGVGVLVNTSMNVKGEPIVESPADAIAFLRATQVDALVMGPYLCARTEAEMAAIRARSA